MGFEIYKGELFVSDAKLARALFNVLNPEEAKDPNRRRVHESPLTELKGLDDKQKKQLKEEYLKLGGLIRSLKQQEEAVKEGKESKKVKVKLDKESKGKARVRDLKGGMKEDIDAEDNVDD